MRKHALLGVLRRIRLPGASSFTNRFKRNSLNTLLKCMIHATFSGFGPMDLFAKAIAHFV